MASINFQKMTQANVGGMKVHLDQNLRETANHSNENINPELSHLNYTIGTHSFDETYERLLERTREVDSEIPPKRVKSDRVICDSAYIVCPQQLEDRQQEFFEKAYEWFQQEYGEENVHGAFVHLDEKHEYRDCLEKDEEGHQVIKESLYHAHIIVSCYTDEKGINSKAFNSREMFREAQKDFNDYIQQEFEISYQTGRECLHERVEVLKEASREIEELELTLERSKERSATLNQEIEQQQEQQHQLEKQLQEQQQQQQELQQQQEAMQQLIRLQEQEIERNEEVTTQVHTWFGAHQVQQVQELEPLKVNEQVEVYTLHEGGIFSPTHEYVLKEDFDKAIESMSQQVEQANKAVDKANEAIRDVNRDNQHNYEVERANVSLQARNEALERENDKYALEDVNSLNKSLEAEKGQLQQELNKAKGEIQELNQANKELEQENDNLVHQNNILKETLERIVEFIDKALQPVIENPIIATLCSYLTREQEETVKEAEAEYYNSKAVEERVVSYDRDDDYSLER